MTLNKKHTTPSFSDFQRYHADEMSATERHSFEKSLLDNPFMADAYEGYLSMLSNAALDRTKISTELKDYLQKRIQTRRRRISPLWTSAAAAGIVVALGAGWLLFRGNQPTPNTQTAHSKVPSSIIQTPAKEIQEKTAIEPEKSQAKKSQKMAAFPEKKRIKKTEPQTLPDGGFDPNAKLVFPIETALSEAVSKEEILSKATLENIPLGNAPQFAQKKNFMIRGLHNPTDSVAAARSSQAPQIVTGRIVDENGAGMPSVTISYGPSHATQRTTTDASGMFQINSKPGDILRLSMLGYRTKQVVITNPNLENISLEADSQDLQEVVVVGYGTQKKGSYIGATGRKDPTDHTLTPTREASPVYGWTYYNNYLTKNTSVQTVEGTIVVSFTVGRNGKLRNIDAKGPQNLRKKAIYLVKMGSEWRPAYKNNKPVASKRTVRLQFSK